MTLIAIRRSGRIGAANRRQIVTFLHRMSNGYARRVALSSHSCFAVVDVGRADCRDVSEQEPDELLTSSTFCGLARAGSFN
jgi:hypothetical protein